MPAAGPGCCCTRRGRPATAGGCAALTGEGRFAFETRNPLARAWEKWTPDNAAEVTGPDGAPVRMASHVDEVAGGLVSFTATYTSPGRA